MPQLYRKANRIRRRSKKELFNIYHGIGVAVDGFTPGLNVPPGFEIKPFKLHPNLVMVAEVSPRFMVSVYEELVLHYTVNLVLCI